MCCYEKHDKFFKSAKYIVLILITTFCCCLSATAKPSDLAATSGPEALRQEIKTLKNQVKVLNKRIDVLSSKLKSRSPLPSDSELSTGGIAILFGAFCALWA